MCDVQTSFDLQGFAHPSLDENELLLLKAKYAVLLAEHKQLQEHHERLRKRQAKVKEKARRKRLLRGWDSDCRGDYVFKWLQASRRNILHWDYSTRATWGCRYQVAHATGTPIPTKEEFKAKLIKEHKERARWYLLGSVEKFPCP